jgi:hypothetical protein
VHKVYELSEPGAVECAVGHPLLVTPGERVSVPKKKQKRTP